MTKEERLQILKTEFGELFDYCVTNNEEDALIEDWAFCEAMYVIYKCKKNLNLNLENEISVMLETYPLHKGTIKRLNELISNEIKNSKDRTPEEILNSLRVVDKIPPFFKEFYDGANRREILKYWL